MSQKQSLQESFMNNQFLKSGMQLYCFDLTLRWKSRHSFQILMVQVAPLPVHTILTDRTELSALSWSLFYILDLPAHLAGAGLGGLVSSPVAPRVATDTLMPGPSEASASANQRDQTRLSDQSEAELTQAAVEHRHWPQWSNSRLA